MLDLERLAGNLAALRPVRIDANRCLPLISRRSGCAGCAAVCPEGAIDPGRLPETKACSGCGLCTAACPADAIFLESASDQELLQRFAALARRSPHLVLTCPSGPAGDIQVGCLGRLTPELLLAAAACGFATIDLATPPETCQTCRYHAGRQPCAEAVAAVAGVLQQLGHPGRLRLAAGSGPPPAEAALPAAAPSRQEPARRLAGGDAGARARPPGAGAAPVTPPLHRGRRAFLASAFGLLRELAPLSPPAAAGPPHQPPGPPRSSRRREILLWALTHWPEAPLDRLPWGTAGVELVGLCHLCNVCGQLCPNGAIRVQEGRLQLSPQHCHHCGLCTRVCPTGALGLGQPRSLSAIAAGGWLSLGRPAHFSCARCGREVRAERPGAGGPPPHGPSGATAAPHLCLPCSLQRAAHSEVIKT